MNGPRTPLLYPTDAALVKGVYGRTWPLPATPGGTPGNRLVDVSLPAPTIATVVMRLDCPDITTTGNPPPAVTFSASFGAMGGLDGRVFAFTPDGTAQVLHQRYVGPFEKLTIDVRAAFVTAAWPIPALVYEATAYLAIGDAAGGDPLTPLVITGDVTEPLSTPLTGTHAPNVIGNIRPANANRMGVSIYNDSDATVGISIGGGVSVILQPGDYYETPWRFSQAIALGSSVGFTAGLLRWTEWSL